MQIKLDFRTGVPIYLQIMTQIKQLLSSGELKPGDQLPTVRQLATDLRVNFNTVARAYRMLDNEGIISTQHGRGTYIWESVDQETNQAMRMDSLAALTRWYIDEALRHDYTLEEIESMFQEQIAERYQLAEPNQIHKKGE